MDNALILRRFNDNNSSISNDFLVKCYMNHHTMVIYTQYEFHESPSIAYLVMAEDKIMAKDGNIH